jgi:hypothetical protein
MLNGSETLAWFLFALAFLIWTARRRVSHNILNTIPGPKAPSWIYGNIPQYLLSEEYGQHEFQWQEKYGPVYLIKGCLGASSLSDKFHR